MNLKNTTVFVMIMIASLSCIAQDDDTYWEINNIYREDQSDFKGLTADAMQKILDYNFHFVKKGNDLHFDLPAKFKIDLASFKSLAQLHINNKDYYEMYGQSFERDTFKVKFRDLATMTDSRNTIIEFIRISKAAYEDHLEEEIAEQKAIAGKIAALKLELASRPGISLEPTEKLPQKKQVIEDDKGKAITLLIPDEIDLKKSGQIKTEQFGAIKIGTLVKNSVVYDIVHPKEDYGLKQLSIWVSTEPADFDLAQWTTEHPNRVIFKEDNNGLIGYDLDYDPEKQQAIISAVFSLKYKKVGQAHVFIYADVYRAQFSGNYDALKEMNQILNFNHLISDHISIQ